MTVGSFFEGRSVLVTGAGGLVGSAFARALAARGARVRAVRHERAVPATGAEIVEGDLRDAAFCRRACRGVEMVVHAAGVSGGSRRVQVDPIPMFTDSLWMNTVVLEAARREGVRRLLFVSNSSVYPPGDAPLREETGDAGAPENDTGMVKRAGETQARLYARTGALQVAIIRTGNAFGPHDNFDLDGSHVVPALVRKAVEGGPFRLWGDGSARRDFIHTHDIARGGLFLLERCADGRPVNVASGRVVSILDVARLVLAAAGRPGDAVELTGDAPPAPPAKILDLGRMRAAGFAPEWTLEQGLADTVAWYRASREARA